MALAGYDEERKPVVKDVTMQMQIDQTNSTILQDYLAKNDMLDLVIAYGNGSGKSTACPSKWSEGGMVWSSQTHEDQQLDCRSCPDHQQQTSPILAQWASTSIFLVHNSTLFPEIPSQAELATPVLRGKYPFWVFLVFAANCSKPPNIIP